ARESFDLSDDELYSLVRALAARTSRITILTDSCHSGGGMRGLAPKTVRSAEHGGRPITAKSVEAFWPHDVEFLDDADPRRLPFPYVHLAACAEDELANEASDDGETVFGAFTYYVAMALDQLRPATTYEDLGHDVSIAISSKWFDQHPQLEGDL